MLARHAKCVGCTDHRRVDGLHLAQSGRNAGPVDLALDAFQNVYKQRGGEIAAWAFSPPKIPIYVLQPVMTSIGRAAMTWSVCASVLSMPVRSWQPRYSKNWSVARTTVTS